MATFTWKTATSGSWTNALLWAGGIPNDPAADAEILLAGPYTVTIAAGNEITVNKLTQATSVALTIGGSLTLGDGVPPGPADPVNLSSFGPTTIEAGGALRGEGAINLQRTSLTNKGLVEAAVGGATLRLFSPITGAVATVENTGTFAATGDGALLNLDRVDLLNLSNNTLTGGTYIVTGTPDGGTSAAIRLVEAVGSSEILSLAATVRLAYVNSLFLSRTAPTGTQVELEASLATILEAGRLELLGGRGWTSSTTPLTVNGTMVVEGGIVNATKGITIGATGTFEGHGTVNAPLVVDGLLHVTGGALATQSLTGSGSILVDSGSQLRLIGGSYAHDVSGPGMARAQAGTVAFTGALGADLIVRASSNTTIDIAQGFAGDIVMAGTNITVKLDNAASFTGTIFGLQTGNRIDLAGVSALSAGLAGGDLQVTTAGGTLTFDLAGDYAGKTFTVASDGAGGSYVGVNGVSFSIADRSWADDTVTWSFAASNFAGGFGVYSSFISPASQAIYAQAVRDAFAAWANVSGLTFVEVADTPTATGQPDIRVGWGNFSGKSEIGDALYAYSNLTGEIQPGVLVRLQDPGLTPLVNSGGTLVYQGTQSSLAQVLMHEIGHAIGLDHANAATDASSLMAPIASAANRVISASDAIGVKALYAGVPPEVPVVGGGGATLNIAATDATRPEGQAGGSAFVFTVTRTGDTSAAGSVGWAVTGTGPNAATAADFVGGVLPSGTVAFAAGATAATITVSVAGDTAVEPNEGFTVTLSNPSAGGTLGTASAGGTIQNDDAVLSLGAGVDAAEGSAGSKAFVFTVSRTGNLATSHSASWAVTGSGANPATAADFAGGAFPTGTVTFAAGAPTATITVNVAGDTAVEASEGFTVTLFGPSTGATIGTASGSAVIRNDDADLSFSAGVASVVEGTGANTQLVYSVLRTGDLSTAHTATWAVAGAGAAPANGTDFAGGVLPAGTIAFAPGATLATITLAVAGDSAVEADEAFTLTLSNASAGATIGKASTGTTLVNDDVAPTTATIAIAALSASKPEGTGGTTPFTFTVTRSGGIATPHSVAWSVAGVAGSGTLPATANDFAGNAFPSGTLTFQAGETSKVLTVAVDADIVPELNERFAVTLAAPSAGAVLGTASAQGIIFTDDTNFAVATGGATVAESNAGITPVVFTVTRSGITNVAQSVNFAVSGTGPNPASAGDFAGGVLPAGLLAFAPGETSKTVTVQVAGDTALEPDEQFQLVLSNPTGGASITTGSAGRTILSEESALSVAALSASKPEGTGTSTPFTFTVTRAGGTSGIASATWTVAGLAGSGTLPANAADFVGGVFPTGTVAFAAGETSRDITVLVNADSASELNERFSVTLSNPTGATLGTATAGAVIYNDDSTVTYGTLAVSGAPAATAEGNSGTTPFVFTITRSGDTSATHSASWSVTGTGGAPANAADFGGALPAGTVTFLPGETSRTITVNVAGDTQGEGNETFALSLSNPSAYTVIGAPTQASGTILTDDTGFVATTTTPTILDGTSNTLLFGVQRTGGTSGAVSVKWRLVPVSGTPASPADFGGGTFPSGVASFADGVSNTVIAVELANEVSNEPDETVRFELYEPVGGGITLPYVDAKILSDSASLSIAAPPASKPEGTGTSTPVTFTVTRTGGLATSHSAAWTVAGLAGSGTLPANAADFVGGVFPTGTVSFAPGETTQVITVNVNADSASELNERFSVTLSNPSAGTYFDTATAGAVIYNDDSTVTYGTLAVSGGTSKPEGDTGTTPYVFVVSRTGDTTASHSGTWSIVGSGANPADAADFAAGVLPTGTVAFLPGETSRAITVQVAGDTVVEGDEGFTLLLSNPSAYTLVPASPTAGQQAVIANDDTPTISIAALSASKPEGTGGTTPFTFTVTRTGGGVATHSVTWATAGQAGSGTVPSNAADFAGGVFPSGVVTFVSGETSRVITVEIAADSGYELNERFHVALSGPTGGAQLGTALAEGIVLDDDAIRSTAASEALTGTADANVFLLGGGLDSVSGLGGLDSFRFQQSAIGPAAGNAATLEDFNRAFGEKIDLSAIDAIAGTGTNDAFTFIGTTAFNGTAGQLRWEDLGGGTLLVQGNVNADTTADLTITVKAMGPIDSNWFVL